VPLGLFQFENLLKQRVAFYIFSMMDLSVLAQNSLEKNHLLAITNLIPQTMNFAGLKVLIEQEKLDQNAPILLVCPDGKISREWALTLDEEGFLNVFWALDGYQGLMSERTAKH